MKKKYKFVHGLCPGDVLMLTALVRDIALTYPGEYAIDVETPTPAIWKFNPYLSRSTPATAAEYKVVEMDYGRYMPKHATEAHGSHFVGAFHQCFKHKTGVVVPLTQPRGDLHLSASEAPPPPTPERFWLIFSGGKTDFVTKHWLYSGHQRVVDALVGMGIPVVQAGAAGGNHVHPHLRNVTDLVGKTDLRQLIQLIAKADGIICTITFAMHAAAALGKPCIVTAGGREEPWWEAYHRSNPALGPNAHKLPVNHRFLHTVTEVVCKSEWQDRGCWMSAVVPQPARNKKKKAPPLCKRAVATPGQVVPECMLKITPERIVQEVLSYYYEGTIPPIPEAPVTFLPPVGAPVRYQSADGNSIEIVVNIAKDAPAPAKQLVALPTVSSAIVAVPPPVVKTSPPIEKVPAVPAVAEPLATPTIVKIPKNAAPVYPAMDATAFSLLYGDYPDMHARHIAGITKTLNLQTVKYRVYCNQVCAVTRRLVERYQDAQVIEKAYFSDVNSRKYPAMRKMFRDEDCPIKTKWVMWFDDDTFVDETPNWFTLFCDYVHTCERTTPNVGMIGVDARFWTLKSNEAEWVRTASWYRGKQFRDRTGKPGPGGNCVHFLPGSFWAMKTEVITACDIPDARLTHNGGDIAIGEAVYQGGYSTCCWLRKKGIIKWSAVPRRGANETIFNL